MPSLEKETKFDFSDGDWIGDKSLSVLADRYMDTINSLSMRLLVLDLEEELVILDSAMWDIYTWIDTQDWEREDFWNEESLFQPEWQFVRNLSKFVKQYLGIEIEITKLCLEKIIDRCVHF